MTNKNKDTPKKSSSFASPETAVPALAPDVAAPHMVNADNQGKPLIVAHNLHKTYYLGQTLVHALRGISLEVSHGEFVAVRGPSGSGKSTFMHLIGCLDRPTHGSYWLAGRQASDAPNPEMAPAGSRMLGCVVAGLNPLS